MTSGFGSVWLAGPLRIDTDAQREYAEVVRAAPDAGDIEATVDVGQPMTALVATDDAIWAARAGRRCPARQPARPDRPGHRPDEPADGHVRAIATTGSGIWTARSSADAVALTAWDGQTLTDIDLPGTPASITATTDAPASGSDVAYVALGDGGLVRVTAAGALSEVGATGASVRAVLQDGNRVGSRRGSGRVPQLTID